MIICISGFLVGSFPQKMDRAPITPAINSTYVQEQTYIQGQNFIQTQNYSSPSFGPNQTYNRNSPGASPYSPIGPSYNQPQSLHKKGSLRNGDVRKRSRVQANYELSQDILDKKIEVLERKYGGVKARNAALTIQRAFRRYMLLKKFTAITAMAKAEKRKSRRLPNSGEPDTVSMSGSGMPVEEAHSDASNYIKTYDGAEECLGSLPSTRPLPVRSLSLRERRNVNNVPLPRSQSGTANVCWDNYSGNPHAHSTHVAHSQHLIHYYSPESKHEIHNHSHSHSHSHSHTHPASGSHWTRGDVSGSPSGNGIVRTRNGNHGKKVPPEVPKRTSSISSRSMEPRQHRANGLSKTTENGSLSSVQSSGSDSSISTERVICDNTESCRFSGSPVWKRQGPMPEYVETASETSLGSISHTGGSSYAIERSDQQLTPSPSYKISETVRKRQYRVGLNLFNKKPERGISYLIRRGFVENSPQGVARFLISRKGLSKQMIGEYLGNLQSQFSMAILECFAHELDLSGMQVDVALRKFQGYFRMPGEAQKIERLMEVFSQRYCQCNLDIVARLRSPDTVFVLAFAIIMLNTDLHTPNLKPERRMRLEDFIKNLRGIDDCGDIDADMLAGIYERVKANEFKPGSDHVTQVMKVQATIVGKKPNLALPHRRLVCYCRLYEIPDINKKERPGVHQREVFLFNDLLVITKILSKKKSSVTYTFRNSFPLCGLVVSLFESSHYQYGIRLSQKVDGKILITFNARNEHDRFKFAEDLRESVSEMDEMESLRIEAELERQNNNNRVGTENRDSGVADVEVCPGQCSCQNMAMRSTEEGSIEDTIHESQFKRSALSNSLLDIHEQFAGEKAQRRGSVGSLDSGMSVSFQSSSTTICSRLDKLAGHPAVQKNKNSVANQQNFLEGLFNKRERNLSRSEEPASSPFVKSTEV